jgi:hypothetical protein
MMQLPLFNSLETFSRIPWVLKQQHHAVPTRPVCCRGGAWPGSRAMPWGTAHYADDGVLGRAAVQVRLGVTPT